MMYHQNVLRIVCNRRRKSVSSLLSIGMDSEAVLFPQQPVKTLDKTGIISIITFKLIEHANFLGDRSMQSVAIR